MDINGMIRAQLDKETRIHHAKIKALYKELDLRYGLSGASLPIRFTYDPEQLGAYKNATDHQEEGFYFSLLFIGYCLKNPLSESDRLDLYKHEYAHYMQQHMKIPREYLFQPGIHGSAWKYCCSLIGAAPTPYYQVGESLRKHDYEKMLKNKISDKTVPLKDQYRRKKAYEKEKNTLVRYKIGDRVTHPKFGQGIVEHIEKNETSVHLHIRFGSELKKIDQKWLIRANYRTANGHNVLS